MTLPKNVVDLLRDLIAIPSVNPDGDPGTDQTGELACAEYVADFLKACGAEVTLEEVLPGRPNVIGRFPHEGSEPSPRLLFGPHLDTVSVKGMTIDPFGGEVREGKVWGRGASDTKGSMASMLWALYEHRDRIPGLEAGILFVGFMSEESSQDGSRHFGKHHAAEADFALVGEPTELDVVHAHKACWWLELTTAGRAAHGARPELGENAILKMAAVIDALRDFPAELDRFDDSLLGKSTVSLNMCSGGSRANIVPDSCSLTLDIRATPAFYEAGIQDFLEDFLQKRGVGETKVHPIGISPTLNTDPDHPVIARLRSLGAKNVTAPWFCDAGWLAEAGIPGIAIGPGSIAQAHTKDEWIGVRELEEGADFFGRFLAQLEGGS